MRVVGLLIWYEELPSWLSATVASLSRCCDHVVAVDGGYYLYPGARPASGAEQVEAIVQTAHGVGMGCTVHVPDRVWDGNEVEKRDFAFRLGLTATRGPEDWLFVVDADEVITDVPPDLRGRLADCAEDVAEVQVWWRENFAENPAAEAVARRLATETTGWTSARRLVRAYPSLRCEVAHYMWTAQRGGRTVHLKGRDDWHRQEPSADVTGLRLEHRHAFRDMARRLAAREFYRLRDEVGAEDLDERTGIVLAQEATRQAAPVRPGAER